MTDFLKKIEEARTKANDLLKQTIDSLTLDGSDNNQIVLLAMTQPLVQRQAAQIMLLDRAIYYVKNEQSCGAEVNESLVTTCLEMTLEMFSRENPVTFALMYQDYYALRQFIMGKL